ncbi:Protein Wnt-2b [Papilio xuthus]|uniref:Protein Wnt n=1 Tax=Papilio xuthus TaxID=66420 RepID=A0A194PLZ9_PAPXU|nr:Protein Wnt-2b [Papilio xuthus]
MAKRIVNHWVMCNTQAQGCNTLWKKSTTADHCFRESAFLYALTSAGVTHAIARACAQGRLLSCGCDSLGYRTSHDPRGRTRANKWEWSGCSHNLAYGIEFTKKFLDVREQVDDLQSKINVHNNNAGRTVIISSLYDPTEGHGAYPKLGLTMP